MFISFTSHKGLGIVDFLVLSKNKSNPTLVFSVCIKYLLILGNSFLEFCLPRMIDRKGVQTWSNHFQCTILGVTSVHLSDPNFADVAFSSSVVVETSAEITLDYLSFGNITHNIGNGVTSNASHHLFIRSVFLFTEQLSQELGWS